MQAFSSKRTLLLYLSKSSKSQLKSFLIGYVRAVALPLKGNEFQANHNDVPVELSPATLLLYLSKVTNFKQITTERPYLKRHQGLLLYLSKVTNFKQITTSGELLIVRATLLLYLSKVTNFKQITTIFHDVLVGVTLLLYLSKVTNFKQITTCRCWT